MWNTSSTIIVTSLRLSYVYYLINGYSNIIDQVYTYVIICREAKEYWFFYFLKRDSRVGVVEKMCVGRVITNTAVILSQITFLHVYVRVYSTALPIQISRLSRLTWYNQYVLNNFHSPQYFYSRLYTDILLLLSAIKAPRLWSPIGKQTNHTRIPDYWFIFIFCLTRLLTVKTSFHPSLPRAYTPNSLQFFF